MNHLKKHWKDYLTIIFFLLFVVFVYYFYYNIQILKHNPCELCVEQYGFMCSDNKGLVLTKGYDWDGSESIKQKQADYIWLENYSIQK